MEGTKSLIIYFSRAYENHVEGSTKYIEKGNTEIIAEFIKDITRADMFKVEPLEPYSEDYMECIEEARLRTKTHNAPIKENITDISKYEIIYIGTPVYWGGMPEEMITALKEVDFKGKIIRPFVTHEGSGMSNIPKQLKVLCKDGEVIGGIAIIGSKANMAREEVENWVG